jgi:hypothetical protein
MNGSIILKSNTIYLWHRNFLKYRMGELLIIILFLIPILCLSSCEKSGIAHFSNMPVVEAYLSPGEKIQVKVTAKTPYDLNAETSSININALEIHVTFHGSDYILIPLGEGMYADTGGYIPIMADSTYTLSFNFDGTMITSSTVIPIKPENVTQSATTIKMSQFDPDNPTWATFPDPVVITFSNYDQSYYLATVECLDTTLVPVYKDSIPANDMFSSIPVSGTEINIEPMRIRYFGMNRIILYHINPEYTAFFMQQASTSQNYQDPPTNIDNGLGIFTGINADTLFLNVVQVK